jgi:hypothetical protein
MPNNIPLTGGRDSSKVEWLQLTESQRPKAENGAIPEILPDQLEFLTIIGKKERERERERER